MDATGTKNEQNMQQVGFWTRQREVCSNRKPQEPVVGCNVVSHAKQSYRIHVSCQKIHTCKSLHRQARLTHTLKMAAFVRSLNLNPINAGTGVQIAASDLWPLLVIEPSVTEQRLEGAFLTLLSSPCVFFIWIIITFSRWPGRARKGQRCRCFVHINYNQLAVGPSQNAVGLKQMTPRHTRPRRSCLMTFENLTYSVSREKETGFIQLDAEDVGWTGIHRPDVCSSVVIALCVCNLLVACVFTDWSICQAPSCFFLGSWEHVNAALLTGHTG